ncbi:ADP-ribosylation/Crystallin J1 [Hypoxylon rubiginosum]|uniref:ADP-ribosylation/Crystallin J1 n=1 Tax=Hypoxylon rubiginosum TaxID=110542 RepID=A0ACC0CJS3_9PEZI|nr:ADP-ribosylation/Crystallin J1 [Hypoxylon rubiginosum]
MASLPEDYLERVYAGVLGKLIGVYLGRPFEGWTHQRILAELGHIRYYVNDRLGSGPVVATDDDISGTFTFVRALEEHAPSAKDLPSPGSNGKPWLYDKVNRRKARDNLPSSTLIGRTWLNNVINRKTVFWWGGNGISTEHTAYLNLRKGIEAPQSGSIKTNGKTIAEQIGAQIFIDGWAMTVPGDPDMASIIAESAGSVSHDGESVNAAVLWAAMEAEAFVSSDVEHLLETGLNYTPLDSLINELVADVRSWCKEDGDWLKTRQRIEDKYGYDKFPGFCHVIPNHGIMIMALIYASHDFHEAMHIVNTCGWDTDCNSGNLACLIAIMHGLKAFENGPDWRGPVADRAFISSADGGYSINNAARIAYDIANMGRRHRGLDPLPPPKDGAQFHFSLPGSVQGFRLTPTLDDTTERLVKVEQAVDGTCNRPGLAIRVNGLGKTAANPVEVMTDTFAPPETQTPDGYNLVSSPLVYPGQYIRAVLRADDNNTGPAQVRFLIRAYTFADELETLIGNSVTLAPGESEILEDTIPTILCGRPVQSIGLAISNTSEQKLNGTIWLDSLGWDGYPRVSLKAADGGDDDKIFYKQSFVNGADVFSMSNGNGKFVVAQDAGEGIVSYGTREWTDYRVEFKKFSISFGGPAGIAVRVRGLNRYYAVRFIVNEHGQKCVELTKALDEHRIKLDSTPFEWQFDTPYDIIVMVEGGRLSACVGEGGEVEVDATDMVEVEATDMQYPGGGIGLIATDGSLLVESIEIDEWP